MARAIAHRFARAGYGLQLAARTPKDLEADAADLRLRYQVPVQVIQFDATATDTHQSLFNGLSPLPDVVVAAVGVLVDQAICDRDPSAAVALFRANFEGPAHALLCLAPVFAARGSGSLVGISSVAGERGRASNFAYGAAKAGFTAFLSGLRNRLQPTGVRVVTVLPGFVRTRMTEGMALPPALTTTPEVVGEAIFRAITGNRDVIYVLPVWRWIMAIIRAIPEPLFKRMKL